MEEEEEQEEQGGGKVREKGGGGKERWRKGKMEGEKKNRTIDMARVMEED